MAARLPALAGPHAGDVARLWPPYRDRPGGARADVAAQHAFRIRAEPGGEPELSREPRHRRDPRRVSAVAAVGNHAADSAGRPHRHVMRRFGFRAHPRFHRAVVLTCRNPPPTLRPGARSGPRPISSAPPSPWRPLW